MDKLTVKYLGETDTMVRSFGKKIQVSKGDIVEVSENEYKSLRGSYKNLFEFSKEEDKQADIKKEKSKSNKKDKKAKVETSNEEEIEEVETKEEETTDDELVETSNEEDNPFK